MKKYLLYVFVLTLLVSSIGFSQSRVLTSKKVTNGSAPTVDGIIDAVWNIATETTVQLGETYDVHNPASIMDCAGCHSFNSSYTVKLKSVYTSSRIYMLAVWPDSTASFTRGGSWSFATNSWTKPNGTQSEDRVSLIFPIGQIRGNPYNTGGCMSKCHTYWPDTLDPHHSTHGIVDDAWLDSGRADIWHSKAARGGAYTSASGTNLVIDPLTHQVTGGTFSMTGFIDDKYVDVWAPDSVNGEDGGRYGDAGTSCYSHNRISDKSRPKYMEKNPADYADAMFLTQEEITGGQCVGNATTGVSDSLAAIYWPNYAALNAIVPERILRAPAGSRGDIDFGAVWNNNMWTAEFSRLLQTGHDDDIQFTESQFYLFNVAAFENSRHGYEHRTSRTDTLKFDQNIGISGNQTIIPDVYYLSQNYPNPFNPTTEINFGLPKNGLVSIKIFDVTGREVFELVNEELKAGTYNVSWNSINKYGNHVSSGVYFYRIVANDFMQTNKMILLK